MGGTFPFPLVGRAGVGGSLDLIVAITTNCGAGQFLNDVMINPFRNQQPRFVDGCFRVVNTVKCRTCPKRRKIGISEGSQFTIRSDHSALATTGYVARILTHPDSRNCE